MSQKAQQPEKAESGRVADQEKKVLDVKRDSDVQKLSKSKKDTGVGSEKNKAASMSGKKSVQKLEEVSFERVSDEGLSKSYKVRVKKEEFSGLMAAFLADKARSMTAPGFRPGRVPPQMVQKRFGPEAFERVSNFLIQDKTQKLVRQEGLSLLDQPQYALETDPSQEEKDAGADKGADKGDFVFRVDFKLRPETPSVSFSGLTIEDPDIQISAEDTDTLVKTWVSGHKKTTPVTPSRAAKVGDVVVVDIAVTPPKGDAHRMAGVELMLSEESLGQALLNSFVGKKVGDTVTVRTDIPKTAADKSVAGKRLPTTYALKEVCAYAPLSGPEDLPKALGLKDLDDVKSKALSILKKRGEELSFLWSKRQVLDFLESKAATFDLPAGMAQSEEKRLWEEALRQVDLPDVDSGSDSAQKTSGKSSSKKDTDAKKSAGKSVLSPEDKKKREKSFQDTFGKGESELKAFFEKAALRRVRLGFLLSALGQKKGVTVTEEETKKLLTEEIMRHRGQEKQVADYYQKNSGALESLRAPYFEDKVVRFVLADLAKKPCKVSLKDLESRLEDEAGAFGAA